MKTEDGNARLYPDLQDTAGRSSASEESAFQLFQRAGLGDGLADGGAEREDGGRGNGQLVDADGQEGLEQGDVRAELAADADPDAGGVGRVSRDLDRAQDGGVMRVEELAPACASGSQTRTARAIPSTARF